jgi:hypothetical protein
MEQKKFQALVGQLSGNEMSDREKLSLVEIMAPFNFLYCHQVGGIGGGCRIQTGPRTSDGGLQGEREGVGLGCCPEC